MPLSQQFLRTFSHAFERAHLRVEIKKKKKKKKNNNNNKLINAKIFRNQVAFEEVGKHTDIFSHRLVERRYGRAA